VGSMRSERTTGGGVHMDKKQTKKEAGSIGKPVTQASRSGSARERSPDGSWTIPEEWKWGGCLLGDAIAILATVSFFFLCMILPLVGKSGAQVAWYGKNFIAFTLGLIVTLLLAIVSTATKWTQRKAGNGDLPKISLALIAICLCLMGALFKGWLAI